MFQMKLRSINKKKSLNYKKVIALLEWNIMQSRDQYRAPSPIYSSMVVMSSQLKKCSIFIISSSSSSLISNNKISITKAMDKSS
jgi:hypothetical protein